MRGPAGSRRLPEPEQIHVKSLVTAVQMDAGGVTMINRFIGIGVLAVTLALPALAQAQGVPGGMERGARDGDGTR